MTATDTVRMYVKDVIHRARVPMPPFDYVMNGDDQPRRHKVYPDVPSFTLPIGSPVADGLSTSLNRPTWTDENGALDPSRLGRALNDTYGLLSRRLRVTGNYDVRSNPRMTAAIYARGTANGGGLYPLEMYWVSGASTSQTPGVYYWDTSSGNLRRVLAGNVSDRVRAAVGDLDHATDQFLVVTVKFWKNSFKYNSFTHHVVTMDLGATLASLGFVGVTEDGSAAVPHMWFDSAVVDDLLGLDPLDETAMAVLPLPAGPLPMTVPEGVGSASVEVADMERSVVTHRFEQISDVIEATLVPQSTPDVTAVARASTWPDAASAVSLPPPPIDGLTDGISEVLERRRSSFGTFSAHTSLTSTDLATLLHVTAEGARLRTDAGRADFARVAVFVNHVDGVPPGAYFYDDAEHRLLVADDSAPGEFLQQMYFLDNYNVEQAAAVITVLVPVDSVLDKVGDRGVRLLNAVVGSATQSCYVAASAIGVACGAALGFDNVSYAERLGLPLTDEWPMIALMVGHDRGDQANYLFPLSATTHQEST